MASVDVRREIPTRRSPGRPLRGGAAAAPTRMSAKGTVRGASQAITVDGVRALQPRCNRTRRHEPTRNVTSAASEGAPARTRRHALTRNDTNRHERSSTWSRTRTSSRPLPKRSRRTSRARILEARLRLSLGGGQGSAILDRERDNVSGQLQRGLGATTLQPNATSRTARDVTKSASGRVPAAPGDTERHGTTRVGTDGRRHG